MRQNLDEGYLGQRLPGTLEERVLLLGWHLELIRKEGEQWVRENARQLLVEAQDLVDQGELNFLVRQYQENLINELS